MNPGHWHSIESIDVFDGNLSIVVSFPPCFQLKKSARPCRKEHPDGERPAKRLKLEPSDMFKEDDVSSLDGPWPGFPLIRHQISSK